MEKAANDLQHQRYKGVGDSLWMWAHLFASLCPSVSALKKVRFEARPRADARTPPGDGCESFFSRILYAQGCFQATSLFPAPFHSPIRSRTQKLRRRPY